MRFPLLRTNAQNKCDTVLTAALFDSIDLPRHATVLGRWLERRRYVKFLNDNSMGGWY